MRLLFSYVSRCATKSAFRFCLTIPDRMRRFAALLVILLAAMAASPSIGADSLPPPEAAGFEHVIVVMMENRSFDHFLVGCPEQTASRRD